MITDGLRTEKVRVSSAFSSEYTAPLEGAGVAAYFWTLRHTNAGFGAAGVVG